MVFDGFDASNDWYHDMPGSILIQAEQKMLNLWLSEHRVASVLQIGGIIDLPCAVDSKVKVTQVVEPNCLANKISANCITAHYHQLPIQSDTMDMVLLPHVLAYADSTLPILQEAYRVLKPNGQLIVIDLNSAGVWRPFFEKQRFLSGRSVKKTLVQLGLNIVNYQTVCFRPPIKNKKWTRWLLFLEIVGWLLFPAFGAGFMIVAVKEIEGMTAIPALQKKPDMKWAGNPIRQTNRNIL